MNYEAQRERGVPDPRRGTGIEPPAKVLLCRHAAPARHPPVIRDGKQGECIEALERLDVPLDASRDEAARTLRAENGYQFRNAVVHAARDARHSSPL